MDNLTIFDSLYQEFKRDKKIRLIELFAGYGSQNLSLKYLGANYEHYKICEWAIKSIQAYNDLHIQDYTDYSKDMSKDEVISYLFNKGVSSDYNKPMDLQEIKRKGESWQRQVYNNIIATNNLVNIQQVKGSDLEIVDTDKYDYLMTYSFPCQDLSVAGKGKGMSDTSTRSGMIWEVERILDECQNLPQILLMENVPQVHSKKNLEDFKKWLNFLNKKGYSNFYEDLNAKNYGIPQNRNRCFMISILGEYSYTFPKNIELKLRIKNMLEDSVDEKYYLSKKMINYCLGVNQKESKFPRKERFVQSLKTTNEKGIATTINTKCGTRPVDNFVLENIEPKRIRKLTPKECFRLMGVKDEDFENIAKNQSNSGLYHLAGDSIVTTVLMAILGKLLGIDYELKINELLKGLANANRLY